MKNRSNQIFLFFNKHYNAVFFTLSLFVMFMSLGFNFVALSKNLIFSDEGWYLCLLRDLPRIGSTQFHLLFYNVFNNNIYHIRIACWALQLLGSVVFAWGLFSMACLNAPKCKKLVLFIFILSMLYWGQMGITACPSFNYISLNKVIMEFCLGFLMVGVSKNRLVYYVLSGFSVAFLFPVMITNVVVIPFVFFAILFVSKNKWRSVLSFVSGVLLFAIYYFVFIESPTAVLGAFSAETNQVIQRGDSAYGIVFLFNWLLDTFGYFGKCFFEACALSVLYHMVFVRNVIPVSRLYKMLAVGIVSFVILVYSWLYIEPVHMFPYKEYGGYLWVKDVYWILLFVLLLNNVVGKMLMNKKEIVLIVLMIIIPICLSFGSDVPFYIRSGAYAVFIIPALIHLVFKKGGLWKMVLLVLFMISLSLFISTIAKGKNWAGTKFFGETVPVKSIGIEQNLGLPENSISDLSECKKRIPRGERVLCSGDCWGFVCLLDYTPISYEFEFARKDSEEFRSIIEKELEKEGHLWLVLSKWKYEHRYIEKLDEINDCLMDMDTIGDYMYIKLQRKSMINVCADENPIQ